MNDNDCLFQSEREDNYKHSKMMNNVQQDDGEQKNHKCVKPKKGNTLRKFTSLVSVILQHIYCTFILFYFIVFSLLVCF